jgi:hypothetical protein
MGSGVIESTAYAGAMLAVEVDPEDVPEVIQRGAVELARVVDELGPLAGGWRVEDGRVVAGVDGESRVIADVRAFPAIGEFLALVTPELMLVVADWMRHAAQREQGIHEHEETEDIDHPEGGDEAFGALVVAQMVLREYEAAEDGECE